MPNELKDIIEGIVKLSRDSVSLKTVHIPPDLHQRLKVIAAESGVNIQTVIVHILERYLKNLSKKSKSSVLDLSILLFTGFPLITLVKLQQKSQ